VLTEGVSQFINAQIEDVQRRLKAYESRLEDLRGTSGRPLSPSDLLPYEVLQETYKTLLFKGEESGLAMNLERRQIGEQLRVTDPPRLPERPVGPSRLGVNLAGTFAGFGLGLVLMRRRVARTSHPAKNVRHGTEALPGSS
jgi:uncharacterized protein involved in exopolysaccharide biosynthesis